MNTAIFELNNLIANRKYADAQKQILQLNLTALPPIEYAQILFYSGICSFELDGICEAEKKYMKCINYCEENGVSSLSAPYYELSLVYLQKYSMDHSNNNLEVAITYCQKALAIALENSLVEKQSGFMVYQEDSPEAYINMAIQLAVLYQEQKDYEKSIELLLLCKSVCRNNYDLYLLGQIYDELGTSYMLYGNQILGFYNYNKSIIAKMKSRNQKGLAITLSHLQILWDKNVANQDQWDEIVNYCIGEQI